MNKAMNNGDNKSLPMIQNVNRLFAGIVALSLTAALAGCGKKEVEVYKTKHVCGELNIDTLDKIIFEPGTPCETVSKTIKDLCICEYHEEYIAYVPVNWKNFSGELEFHFNADKEFDSWEYTKNYGESYYASNYADIYQDYLVIFEQIKAERNEPDAEQKHKSGYIYQKWNTDFKDADNYVYRVDICLNNGGYIYFAYY